MPMNVWPTARYLRRSHWRRPLWRLALRRTGRTGLLAPRPGRPPGASNTIVWALVLAPLLASGCTQETDPLAPYDRSDIPEEQSTGATAASVQPRTDALQDELTPLEADIAEIDRELTQIRQARAGDARASYDRLLEMRDDVDRAELLLDYLREEVNDEIRVQSTYLGSVEAEAAPLLTSDGTSRPADAVDAADPALMATGTTSGTAPGAMPDALPARTAAPGGGRSPLVVIRFDRASPDYEPDLHRAVTAAVDRKPDVIFDVVAVSPRSGTPAQQAQAADEARSHGRDVFRTLMTMGLLGEQVTFDHAAVETAEDSEVRVFVR